MKHWNDNFLGLVTTGDKIKENETKQDCFRVAEINKIAPLNAEKRYFLEFWACLQWIWYVNDRALYWARDQEQSSEVVWM